MMNWWDEQSPFNRWQACYGALGFLFSMMGLARDSDMHTGVGILVLLAVGMISSYRQVLREENDPEDEEDRGVPEPQVG